MSDNLLFPPGPAADRTRIVYDSDGLKRESSAPCQLNCPGRDRRPILYCFDRTGSL